MAKGVSKDKYTPESVRELVQQLFREKKGACVVVKCDNAGGGTTNHYFDRYTGITPVVPFVNDIINAGGVVTQVAYAT